ncbi:MAG: glycine--tRNA ligase [Euryarchaeota archaeon]|nr:glycine--tRNA ligase [Euryarchaeota archaeon]MBU4608123.1 glycine--tRNA ligase [Euryarchaeota archaeon]MBV1729172.1 glycine--tRNA ligase [Methanobacterium sp.]MBV1754578.1 glycine--tRNA ligase [Methanobacterium sp.]
MKHDQVMNVAKKRGFLWSSFEIYSGVAGFVDYGPLGAILKNKIMNKWRKYYVVGEGFYEIESPTIMPEEALKASGHVDHFTDPMTECKDCMDVYRADHVIEEHTGEDVEGLENQILTEKISENKIRCPRCGGHLNKVWNYNLMFQTLIGAKGKKIGYMRPETAQGIFIPFKRLLRFFRNKLPFGVVQLGKAYRNEISPRQGVIRLREFTQAEAEIFINPQDKSHPRFSKIKEYELNLYPATSQMGDKKIITLSAQEAHIREIVSSEMLIYQLYLAQKFLRELGIPDNALRFRQHLPTEMAHYAIDCWDVEVKTDRYGWIEIIGIADRSDYDLKSHSDYSSEDLKVFMEYPEPVNIKKTIVKPNMQKFGPAFKTQAPALMKFLEETDSEEIKKSFQKNGFFEVELEDKYQILPEHLEFEEVDETIRGEKIFPHVIEPSFGMDRIVYSVLLHCFNQEEDKNYFQFATDIAPVEVSVFPLLNQEDLTSMAQDIKDSLRDLGFIAEYDSSGTIGRRYARSDEIGVPFALTVDHESLSSDTITIRNRDDSQQIRIPVTDIPTILPDLKESKIEFESLKSLYSDL